MSASAGSSVAVIVVAAGSGLRLGAGKPKAFAQIDGVTLLERALHSVFGMSETPQVIVVAPPQLLDEARSIAERCAREAGVAPAEPGCLAVVPGGDTRQRSVAAGLAQVARAASVVLVHDAARALTPSAQLDRVALEVARRGHGVIPGLPVSDTIKRTDADGRIIETVERSELSAVQTPQGFPRQQLDVAYAAPSAEFTDDAALVMAAGFPVTVLPGDPSAFKITTPADLRRAEQLVRDAASPATHPGDGRPRAAAPQRIGLGIDTHAFDPAAELWLAGLHWPGEPGLAGHSDGDAVAHAITDALLAASGLGDIGTVFGTDDPRFDGAHGDIFLIETRRLVEAAGFVVDNVSVQLVGNRPRFSPRRHEAEALLADLVGAPVSVSATTTDGLGFTGRGEGIAAIATALVHEAAK